MESVRQIGLFYTWLPTIDSHIVVWWEKYADVGGEEIYKSHGISNVFSDQWTYCNTHACCGTWPRSPCWRPLPSVSLVHLGPAACLNCGVALCQFCEFCLKIISLNIILYLDKLPIIADDIDKYHRVIDVDTCNSGNKIYGLIELKRIDCY